MASLTVLGGGPEHGRLENLSRTLGIEKEVSFLGWVSHTEALRLLGDSDVLVFPSVRDFGGGVVFEALAVGAVPLVVDFGGPGDIVNAEVGFKVPLTNESDVTQQMEKILNEIAENPSRLSRLRQQGMRYAKDRLTWEAKAKETTKVLEWALRRGPRPDLLPPKSLGKKTAFLHEGDVQSEMPVTGDH